MPACSRLEPTRWVSPQHFLTVARHTFYTVFNGSSAAIFMKSDQNDSIFDNITNHNYENNNNDNNENLILIIRSDIP